MIATSATSEKGEKKILSFPVSEQSIAVSPFLIFKKSWFLKTMSYLMI